MRRAVGKSKRPLKINDPRHGTPGAYHYWQCRCNKCKEAIRLEHQRYVDGKTVTVHNRQGYDAGCRCKTCRADKYIQDKATRAARAEWRAQHSQGLAVKADLGVLA